MTLAPGGSEVRAFPMPHRLPHATALDLALRFGFGFGFGLRPQAFASFAVDLLRFGRERGAPISDKLTLDHVRASNRR
jgi:hypothetical protein